jgi:hypothetical protein
MKAKHTVVFELSYLSERPLLPKTLIKALGPDLDVEGMIIENIKVGEAIIEEEV